MVQKGCWTGPTTGPMQTNQDALPPDYAVVRGCSTDYCNTDLKTHDALPNLSQGKLGGVAGEIGAGPERSGAGREESGLRLESSGLETSGVGLEGAGAWSPLSAALTEGCQAPLWHEQAQPAQPHGSNALSLMYCLLQAPNPPTLSGTECYACLGTRPEDCSLEKSRRVQCHQDQSSCFQGNGRMNIGEGLAWWGGTEGLRAREAWFSVVLV